MRSDPDLKVISEDGIFFVECYTYRKSFGIEEFISELFYHISPKIKVNHISCIPFSLPKNSRTEPFLNEIFSHYLDPLFLENKIKEAEKEYPVLLPVPEKDTKNLYVYIEDSDPNHYIPGISPSSCGDPEEHIKIAIKEALDNKRNSNKLKDYHPNILAVNFLLGKDFQTAFSRQISLGGSIPSPNLGTTFDGVFFAACGINEVPSRERIFLQIKPDKDHPIMNIYGNDK